MFTRSCAFKSLSSSFISSTNTGPVLVVSRQRQFSSGTSTGNLHPSDLRVWEERELDSIFNANKLWSKRILAENPSYLENSQHGHKPKILWIGCSDARVPANEILGQSPGTVFVTRNIANQVIGTDFNVMSVVQYAVNFLKVKHIIVAGHYDCGGVKASLLRNDHGAPLENWVRSIRDTVRLHKAEIDALPDYDSKVRRLVELNVIEQCMSLYKTSIIQKSHQATTDNLLFEGGFQEPRIHPFVVEPTTGQATRLDVSFTEAMKDLKEVYEFGF